jgi:regulator of sigma E protease
MNLLTTILAFAFALGALIIVHEYGHYLVARLCNVKVLRFSVGFGRVIWSRRYGPDQTEWAISAFPLGGYVKMLDEREGEVAPQDLARAFNRQSVSRRFVIVAAGPVANFLLAILLYWLIYMHGIPGLSPVVGAVAPGSPAAAAQFSPGEILIKIGPQAVATWQDARWVLLKHAVEKSVVVLEVRNERNELAWRKLDLSQFASADLDGDFLRALGFVRLQPPLPPVIGQVLPGGAAERSGLQPNDEIVAIDGVAVTRWEQVVATVSGSAGHKLIFEARRGAAGTVRIAVTPEAVLGNGERIGRIGAAARIDQEALQKYVVEVRYPPLASFGKALERTWDTSVFSLKMLGKMITGDVSLKNLSGPLTIADYAGQSARVGWLSYLVFLALISISLGVLNLLPIPLLDGGHLMYYMVEIFKGSPVSDKAIEVGQRVGMALLFMLMSFALYNDINRLIYG